MAGSGIYPALKWNPVPVPLDGLNLRKLNPVSETCPLIVLAVVVLNREK